MSGLSMFTSGFNKLTEVSLYIVSFYSVLVGIILFDILFMLVFFIAKISGHSIARDVPVSDKNWFFSTWHRYPYVYCFHFFAIAVLVILYVLQMVHGTPGAEGQLVEAVASSVMS